MRTGPLRALRDLSPRRRWLLGTVTVVVVGAMAAGLALVAVRLVTDGNSPNPPDQSRPGPVLLVPGYGGNAGSLAALAKRIRATGRTAVVVALPGDGTGDLWAQADALRAAVDRAIVASTASGGAGSVDVIGYSAGGVVVRLWMARYGGDRLARRVVTLGAPLHGARIASVGSAFVPGACPSACQQLTPGSGLLTDLDTHPIPAGLPWLSIWTDDDETVQPPDSARLTGAINVPVQSICTDARLSHGQLPSDPLVAGLVLRAIGSAPVDPPEPADCAVLRTLGS